MKVKILQTAGTGEFTETAWDKPDIGKDEIEVRAVMTGVCRSDIDMMQGRFGPLPIHMQGHEGLGQVTAVGSNIIDVGVGDYVATRGEPGFADYYNARYGTYVAVPEPHQRFILEPVACGVNVIMQCIREIAERSGPERSVLIKGSGFLSWVAYHTLLQNHVEFNCIDVLGSHNLELWGDRLLMGTSQDYDVVIDLGNDTEHSNLKENGLLIQAASKHPAVTTTYEYLLWRAATVMFPSPRNPQFISCMRMAQRWISSGDINVDHFWTRGYQRSNWREAFADAANRPYGYCRGYIVW
jgi:D-arabinose 1-dehydrogenase-like Zn-dependent alcohol dehydrogenase